MKNKFFVTLFSCFLILVLSSEAISTDQFNFDVTEIEILENGNKFKGLKRGKITTNDGIIIESDNFEYDKSSNILNAKGNVVIEDTIKNYIMYSDDVTYFRNDEKIITKNNSRAIDQSGQEIRAISFKYDKISNILNASGNVVIEDTIKNYIMYSDDVTYFRNDEKIITIGETTAEINPKYTIKSKNITFLKDQQILMSYDKTSVKDLNTLIFLDEFLYNLKSFELRGKNILAITNHGLPKSDKFYFSNGIVNLNSKEFVAKDTKVELHKNIFDKSKNDPRIKGVSSKGKDNITKVKKLFLQVVVKKMVVLLGQ